jgi:actin-like ATPase involved in cell morphogenesis
MQKGLISFILLLAFILIYFNLVYSINSLETEKNFTEAKLIEIESASFKRNLIENTIDYLIEEEIEKQINFGSNNAEEIKKKTSQRLMEFFYEMKKHGIEFRQVKANKKYSEIQIKGKEITQKFLEKNTKILVSNIQEKIYRVEFFYTAGITKSNLIGAEIKENQTTQKFFVPAGYSIKKNAVRFVE